MWQNMLLWFSDIRLCLLFDILLSDIVILSEERRGLLISFCSTSLCYIVANSQQVPADWTVFLCLCWRRYVSRVFVRLCMCLNQTLLARYLGYLLTEFDQTFTTNGLWDQNASNFRVKRSRVNITLGSNMPQNAHFALVVVTCWWRHNSRWSCNHHLVWWSICFNVYRKCCIEYIWLPKLMKYLW